MFTKKLEDQFSADLLNTVKGILGEAKKCPKDCECEKCEKEDDEEERRKKAHQMEQREYLQRQIEEKRQKKEIEKKQDWLYDQQRLAITR